MMYALVPLEYTRGTCLFFSRAQEAWSSRVRDGLVVFVLYVRRCAGQGRRQGAALRHDIQ